MSDSQEAFRRIAAFAASQHGVLSFYEALGLGASPDAIKHWLAVGRLERVAPQVFRLAGAPDTWKQRLCIGTLTTNGFASHVAAGALEELDGCRVPPPIEVLTHRWRRRKRGGVILHEAKDLKACDITEVDGIACTNIVRTVLDLAGTVHPYVAALALDHAWRKDPEVLGKVHARFLELARRGRRGTQLMRAMLEERLEVGIPPGSGFEVRCERMLVEVGLPRPVRQHCVTDGDFVAYIDLSWPPIKFGVECDSLAHHSGKRAHEWDRERRRRLKLLGWDLAEVTYDDVVRRPEKVGGQLIELYNLKLASANDVQRR